MYMRNFRSKQLTQDGTIGSRVEDQPTEFTVLVAPGYQNDSRGPEKCGNGLGHELHVGKACVNILASRYAEDYRPAGGAEWPTKSGGRYANTVRGDVPYEPS